MQPLRQGEILRYHGLDYSFLTPLTTMELALNTTAIVTTPEQNTNKLAQDRYTYILVAVWISFPIATHPLHI